MKALTWFKVWLETRPSKNICSKKFQFAFSIYARFTMSKSISPRKVDFKMKVDSLNYAYNRTNQPINVE